MGNAHDVDHFDQKDAPCPKNKAPPSNSNQNNVNNNDNNNNNDNDSDDDNKNDDNGSNDEKQLDDDIEEYMNECIVNSVDERLPIYETSNINDDIISCIGQIRTVYRDDNLHSNTKLGTCIGTGTIFHVQNDECYIITCAHNIRSPLYICSKCNNKRQLTSLCSLCKNKTKKIPNKLIKPSKIEFIRRCIVPEKKGKNNQIIKFGNNEATFMCDLNKCIINDNKYFQYPSSISGYDLCILIIKNNIAANFYNNIMV